MPGAKGVTKMGRRIVELRVRDHIEIYPSLVYSP